MIVCIIPYGLPEGISGYDLDMLRRSDVRLHGLPLNSVVFYNELPAFLGISKNYVRNLSSPPAGPKYDWLRENVSFPKPVYTSESGIRFWFAQDVYDWAWNAHRQNPAPAPGFARTLFERPHLTDRLLGRAPRA